MKARPEILPPRGKLIGYELIDTYANARNTTYQHKYLSHHVIEATELLGDHARTLRKLALIKARHSIAHLAPDPNIISPQLFKIADEIRINAIFNEVFSDDDTHSNYNAREVINLFGTPEQLCKDTAPLRHEYAKTIGTSANRKLTRLIKQPNLKASLLAMRKDINRELKRLKHYLTNVNEDRHTEEYHIQRVLTIAKIIETHHDPKNTTTRRNGKPEHHIDNQKWCKLAPAYPKLELTHNGRMNRKRKPAPMGKTPKYLNRLLTDPDKRIFTKKSKSLGGVVVIDCSGSMSLTNEQITKLVMSASGSTIWCYASSCNDDDIENTWLVAHNGKRVRELPDFHGGNGVDLPALALAKQYRKKKTDPMIWISDGRVTGNNSANSSILRKHTAQFIKRYNIYHVEELNEAIEILTKAQQGKTPKVKATTWQKQALGAN